MNFSEWTVGVESSRSAIHLMRSVSSPRNVFTNICLFYVNKVTVSSGTNVTTYSTHVIRHVMWLCVDIFFLCVLTSCSCSCMWVCQYCHRGCKFDIKLSFWPFTWGETSYFCRRDILDSRFAVKYRILSCDYEYMWRTTLFRYVFGCAGLDFAVFTFVVATNTRVSQ